MPESLQARATRLFKAVEPGDVDALLNARDQFTDEDWEVLKRSPQALMAFQAASQRAILPDDQVETTVIFFDKDEHCIPGLCFPIRVPKARREKEAMTRPGTIHIDGLTLSIRQDEDKMGVTIEVLRRQDLEYLGGIWIWQELGGTRLTFDGQGRFDALVPYRGGEK